MAIFKGRRFGLWGFFLMAILIADKPASAVGVTLRWDPQDDPQIVAYRIYAATDTNSLAAQVSVDAPQTVATVTNLAPATPYYFAATAVGSDGSESDFSDVISYVTPNSDPQPTNSPPRANAQSITTAEGQAVSFQLTASDANGDPLTFSITAPPSKGVLSGTAPNLVFTPAPGVSGSDQFTFSVSDGKSSASAIVTLTINHINHPPTLGAISDVLVNADSGVKTISLTGISTGATNENDTLRLIAISSNPALIATPAINYTSPNATGTLSFAPAAGQTGIVNISVTLDDGQPTNHIAQQTFKVTVARPVVITNLQASALDARTINVTWTTDQNVPSSVDYGLTPSVDMTTAETSGTAHTATLTNLVAGTNYYLRVKATGLAGTTTQVATAATEPAAAIPFSAESGSLALPMMLGVSVQAQNGKYIFTPSSLANSSATYNLNVPRGLNYRVWMRVNVPSGGSNFSISSDGAAKSVWAADDAQPGKWHWTLLADAGAHTNAVQIPMEAGQRQWIVRGISSSTLLDEFAISNDPYWRPILPTTHPVLAATRTSSTSATLTWSDPSGNATNVAVEWSTDGVNFQQLQTVPATAHSTSAGNLTAGATYYFRVYSYNSIDRTGYSNTATAAP
jgi:hypothetical protein